VERQRIHNYKKLWWLIEGKGGFDTGVERLRVGRELEKHFFKMKKVYDDTYLEDEEGLLPRRNIYLD